MQGPQIELRHTSYNYNLAAAARKILANGDPNVASFVENIILNPPAKNTMLEMFGKFELAQNG